MTDLEIQNIETKLKRKLTKREKHLLELAKTNGTDKDLVLMNAIDDLDEKVDEEIAGVKEEFKETVKEIKESVPDLDDMFKSVRGKDGDPGHTPTKDELMPLMEDATKDELEKMKQEMIEMCEQEMKAMQKEKERMHEEMRQSLNFMRDKARSLENGRDGQDGAVGPQGPPGSPDTPEAIADKLELLDGDDRLDRTAIRGITVSPQAPDNPKEGDIWIKF